MRRYSRLVSLAEPDTGRLSALASEANSTASGLFVRKRRCNVAISSLTRSADVPRISLHDMNGTVTAILEFAVALVPVLGIGPQGLVIRWRPAVNLSSALGVFREYRRGSSDLSGRYVLTIKPLGLPSAQLPMFWEAGVPE